ncbi:DUF1489 family protein [Minwuia sp.]|uniref:DUF1489 family protein n=1 Tax=Minwuia sp. TaxID=2493630 RepID=UPI003A943B14
MADRVHLVKLCVGVDRVEQLESYQAARAARGEILRHVTRNRPRRDDEVLNGGSLYWVIAGAIRVRQRIIDLERIQTDDGMKCGLVFDAELVRTEPWARRPHQGWRYLEAKDAPPDLRPGQVEDDLPEELRAHLREIGLS